MSSLPAGADYNWPIRQRTIKFTLSSDARTEIPIKVMPYGNCSLRSLTSDPSKPGLDIFADAAGNARIFATVRPSAHQESRFRLDCTSDAGRESYSMVLRAGASPSADMPAPPQATPARETGTVLPALTREHAERMTDEALRRTGYPPRPNRHSELYAKWFAGVTKPIFVVKPHQTISLSVRHDDLSQNWSGVERVGAEGAYPMTESIWHVPGPGVLQWPPAGVVSYSSIWNGIDGDGSDDLVQAGTELDSVRDGDLILDTIYAWTEFVPRQPLGAVLADLHVTEGDEVYVRTWIAKDDGTMDVSGPSAQFLLWNLTTNRMTRVTTPRGNTVVHGSQAQFVLERPTLQDHSLPALTNYGTVDVYGAYAGRDEVDCCGSGFYTFPLTANDLSTTLSSVKITSPHSMTFTWKDFGP